MSFSFFFSFYTQLNNIKYCFAQSAGAECPVYDTDHSDGEDPVMLEL